MKPAHKIWLNGKIVPLKQAVSLNFHPGLNYGACIYEGIRFYGTPTGAALFRLNEHLERFFYSARALRMRLGFNKKKLTGGIKKVIKANKLKTGYIRPIAFYSDPKMGINILGARVTIALFVWPWKEVVEEKRVTMKIVTLRRLHPATVDLRAKIAGYYVNGLLGFIEAREDGFDEPLFLDTRGYVAEGAVNNIFIVKGNSLYTPTQDNILGGITRDTVIKIAQDLGMRVYQKTIRPEFLRTADEIFLTGTGIELERVTKIKWYFSERRIIQSVIDTISRYYRKIATGGVLKYKKWLTPLK